MSQGKFRISGKEYPIPEFNRLTMDEAITIEEYTGLSLEKFRSTDTGISGVAALLHIALSRDDEHKDTPHSELRRFVGQIDLTELDLERDTEVEKLPPSETQSESVAASSGSGPDSESSSAETRAETRPPIGTPV